MIQSSKHTGTVSKGSVMTTTGFDTVKHTIDILAELEPYMERFERSKLIDNKLISCSPFREDRTPSFVVFLDNGVWVDSGGTDRDKGGFIELLSFLSGQDPETVVEDLSQKYGQVVNPDELSLQIDISLAQKGHPHASLYQKVATLDTIQFHVRHPYLFQRGISEQVQQGFKIGYDTKAGAVVIPWTDTENSVVRLQFRSVTTKKFWFSKEGDRVRNHLFGLYHVLRKDSKTVWIVEAPIDCLYLWTQGIPSVATGTSSISKQQIKLLKNTGVESLVIASDSDTAGQKFATQLIKAFGGAYPLKRLIHPQGKKDVNEMTPEQLMDAHLEHPDLFL